MVAKWPVPNMQNSLGGAQKAGDVPRGLTGTYEVSHVEMLESVLGIRAFSGRMTLIFAPGV